MMLLTNIIKGLIFIGLIMEFGLLFYRYQHASKADDQEAKELSKIQNSDILTHKSHHGHHFHANSDSDEDKFVYRHLKKGFLSTKEKENHQFVHKCDHGNYMKDTKIVLPEFDGEIPIESTQNYELSLLAQHKQGNWRPIRIYADYTNFKGTEQQLKFIKGKLVRAATGFISAAYSVFPSEQIKVTWCRDEIVIPPQYAQGVTGYDLILFVTSTTSDSGFLARAGSCLQDPITRRPIAGSLEINLQHFNKLSLSDPTDKSWFDWVGTTIHEIHHVMGFAASLFSSYVDPSTNAVLEEQNVVKTQDGKTWIIAPKVVARVKGHFECQEAIGAPLENDGGEGTQGSHWERVSFGNEGMTGSSMLDSVFTGFTFALLESSGWYIADYSQSEPFNWGEKEGCAIATAKCNVGLEFCTSGDGCSPDYMGLAECSNQDDLASGCSYWRSFSNTICKFPGDMINSLTTNTGGAIGPEARCFVTSLPKAVGYQTQGSTCFKSECSNESSIKFFVGDKSYTCTQDDQVINVSFKEHSATVKCPKIQRFCRTTRNCPNDCSGVGTCRQTTCNCYKGYAGADCSQEV